MESSSSKSEQITSRKPTTATTTTAQGSMSASVASSLSWQTSNMQYGKFYVHDNGSSTAPTTERRHYRERDGQDQRAEGRCAVLTKTVINCRNQLGHMRLRNTTPIPPTHLSLDEGNFLDPPTTSYYAAHVQRLKSAQSSTPRGTTRASMSSCRYSEGDEEKPRESCSREGRISNVNDSGPQTPLQDRWNYNSMPVRNIIDTSGIEEDTKQLEWLLKRLVEKLQPLTNENEPAITNCDSTPMPNVVKKGNPKANQRTKGNKKDRNWPQMTDQLQGHHKLAPYYKSGPYYKYLSEGENTDPEVKFCRP